MLPLVALVGRLGLRARALLGGELARGGAVDGEDPVAGPEPGAIRGRVGERRDDGELPVAHRELDAVIAGLRTLNQVREVHEISGRGDVWCRVAATDTHNLQAALRSVLRIKGVIRTETVLALHEHIPYRTEPLLELGYRSAQRTNRIGIAAGPDEHLRHSRRECAR